MDERNINRKSEEGRTPSAYRDALYSQAPEDGRNSYGYNVAQCFARASAPEETAPAKEKRRGAAGLIAAVVLLMVCVLVVGLFGSGGIFLVSRVDAADMEQPSRELYEEFTAAQASEDDADALALHIAEEETGAELSAEEIYTTACASTVGVTVPGYAYNIFGQTDASTVTGTGIVLSEDGYILTNYHVIEAAYVKGAAVRVITYDENDYDAEVIGVETDSDIAVLKIEADGLVPAQMGDSGDLRVGQTIYAVGNPLGELTYTMTSGIVSALNRLITTDENVAVNMFQIDAAINSGNSGGPVFNTSGQVIGMVTAKYSLYGMEGLGFAIPISDACEIASDLVEKGYVSGKAYLGLKTATVSPSVARYYGMVQGVYVYTVEEGSCSEAAGLLPGDIITAIDGTSVRNSSELVREVRLYHAGDSAVLTVHRDQETIEITVVFDEELPAEVTEEALRGPASGDLIPREG